MRRSIRSTWLRPILCSEFIRQVCLLTVSFDTRTTDASCFHPLFVRYHNPEAPLEEGLQTLRRCIDEVERRLVISLGKFKVKIVDENGTREIEL